MEHRMGFTFVSLVPRARHPGEILTGASPFACVWMLMMQCHSFCIAQGMVGLQGGGGTDDLSKTSSVPTVRFPSSFSTQQH